MQRRTVLRRGLGVAALTVPLAGCSGDDDDGGDDDGDGSDGGDGGPSATGQSGLNRELTVAPPVSENLTVTRIEEREVTDERLAIDLTLRNDSGQEARMDEYSVFIALYKSDEVTGDQSDSITSTGTSPEYTTSEQEPTASGETVTLGYSTSVAESSDASISSYEITIGCPGVGTPPGC